MLDETPKGATAELVRHHTIPLEGGIHPIGSNAAEPAQRKYQNIVINNYLTSLKAHYFPQPAPTVYGFYSMNWSGSQKAHTLFVISLTILRILTYRDRCDSRLHRTGKFWSR